MNLWDKSLVIRQLTVLVVALFFFSCEDETSLLGFKNPSPKFNVSYIEIPLESSVLLVDSILTDNLSTQGGGLVPFNAVGEYQDQLFGTMRAETYLQLLPSNASKIEETSVYDSVTVQLILNFYSYGFTSEQTMKFNVNEITDPLKQMKLHLRGPVAHNNIQPFDFVLKTFPTFTLDSARNRFFFNSTLQYSAQPLGQLAVTVNYDSLKKEAAKTSGQDTILMSGKLDDNFGTRLFNLALKDPGSAFSDPLLFMKEIKGLVITPAESNGVLGINPLSSLSKVTMHYHTVADGVVSKLEKTFTFGGSLYDPNFTNYTVNRSASEFSALTTPYVRYAPPSGIRGVQSGSPLVTKIDLKPFYQFADTIESAVINSAELVIDGIESNAGVYVHNQFMLKVMKENDQFTNGGVAADNEAMLPYLRNTTVFTPGQHYYVRADIKNDVRGQPATASLNYNSDNNRYSGFVTLFTQDLMKNKKSGTSINPNRITYLAIYPMSPGVSTSVNRTAFNAKDIKIRIYYTRPSGSVKLN